MNKMNRTCISFSSSKSKHKRQYSATASIQHDNGVRFTMFFFFLVGSEFQIKIISYKYQPKNRLYCSENEQLVRIVRGSGSSLSS
jgi:hypothetical protein